MKIFNGKLSITSCTKVSDTTWTIQATFSDNYGQFFATNAIVGDIVYNLALNSTTQDSVITRYKITSIDSSTTASKLVCTIVIDEAYASVSAIYEPQVGTETMVGRISNEDGIVALPPDSDGIPNALITLARNTDLNIYANNDTDSGVGIKYSATVNYEVGDIVSFGGALYKCIANTIGHDPTNTTYWTPYNSSISLGRAEYIFNTQAEMLACTSFVVGDRCKTLCYATLGDDGGGVYTIGSATDAANKTWALAIAKKTTDTADDATTDPQLYALCCNKDRVTYKMWGAVQDGVTDDGAAMRKCHKYADSVYNMDSTGNLKQYLCKVENHQGIIYKTDTDCINFCSDIDLSGSTILVDDTNASWFGYYVWGEVDSLVWDFEAPAETKATFEQDNFVIQQPTTTEDTLPANCVLKLEEEPYCARDDAGYLYTVARRELIVHDADGICSSPFIDDWTSAGGVEINCQVSDLVNGGYTSMQSFTKLTASYTFVPNRHGTFVGCDVQFNTTANKYCSVVWVKRHNATIKDFIFRPNLTALHNTKFKNTMVYLWDSYNVRVQNLQGFNAAGEKESGTNGTSGYILRLTNCSDVYVEDCRMQGYWGVTAMDSVKNIYFKRCHMNRLDIHDYFANLYAEECTFYNHGIQIGYGRGVASFTNCNWYWNEITTDSYPSSHLVEFDITYGRVFEGTVYVDNCRVYTKNPSDGEFKLFYLEFSPDATAITKHFKIPEIICKNVQVYSNVTGTYFFGFKIAGTRKATTGTVAPSHETNYSNDGTVKWYYIGRGVNFGGSVTSITADQILRVYDTFLDEDKKTQFYNIRYYKCTSAGSLTWDTKPTDKTGSAITCGTATLVYMSDAIWQSKHAYSVGDICATNPSNFYPLYVFRCTTAGTSAGYFPTHTTGTVIDGVNDAVQEADSCWWTYVATKASWCTDWTANMTVTVDQIIEAEGRLYKVIKAGTLIEYPPYDTYWFGESDCGTARLTFIGLKWKAKQWYKQDSYCEANGNIYQLANHDGTTSGRMPVPGNAYCVDGDHIWKYVSAGSSGTAWAASTSYSTGNQVLSNSKLYECVYDGKVTLPNNIIFENIQTNMTSGLNIFWFYSGCDVPTKQGDKTWKVIVRNCPELKTTPYGSVTTYFGHSGNITPTYEVDGTTVATNPLPTGGTTGQSLVKKSDTNYDVEWETITASTTAEKNVYREKTVCLGDSLTNGFMTEAYNFPNWLQLLTGNVIYNKGVEGDTIYSLYERLSTDVTPLNPDNCIILGGANNIGGADDTACTAFKTLSSALVSAKIYPIFLAIIPRPGGTTTENAQVRRLNNWLLEHCRVNGFGFIDTYSIFVNSDGTYKTDYYNGGIHLNTYGQYLLATTILPYLPKYDIDVPWRWTNDAENMFTNPLLTDTSSDGIADSWSVSGTTTVSISSNCQLATKDSDTSVTIQSESVAVTAGSTYRIECDAYYENTASSTSIYSPLFKVYLQYSDATTVDLLGTDKSFSTPPARLSKVVTVPTGVTSVTLRVLIDGTQARGIAHIGKPSCYLMPVAP